MKGQTKSITNNLGHQIIKCLSKNNKWLDFVRQQTIIEREDRIFKYISKHAERRIKQRFEYRGYSLDDIKNDIVNSDDWVKHKEYRKIVGTIGTYIISNTGVLITVI